MFQEHTLDIYSKIINVFLLENSKEYIWQKAIKILYNGSPV